jgi:Na+-transporting NADH:ubiquinone oxidoreductase subunit C
LKVIKGQAGTPEEAPHHVDGLSGATITSNGVTNGLRFWLGDNGFGPFITNTLAGKGAATSPQEGGDAR